MSAWPQRDIKNSKYVGRTCRKHTHSSMFLSFPHVRRREGLNGTLEAIHRVLERFYVSAVIGRFA